MDWQPITSAPQDGTPCYVRVGDAVTTAYYFGTAGRGFWTLLVVPGICDALDGEITPSHWAPYDWHDSIQ